MRRGILGLGAFSLALLFLLGRIPGPTGILAGALESGQVKKAAVPGENTRQPARVRETAGGGVPAPLSLPSVPAYRTEAARLKACYSGGCDYPEQDPRSYDFAVGRDLRAALLGLAALAAGQSLESDELSQTGREFLDNMDGYVQDAALSVLATQPPSKENLQAILQFVIGGYDAQLLPAALRELARYRQQAEEELIDNAFAQAMLSGSPFVATFLAGNIRPFLHDGNLRFYRDLYDRLPQGSIYRANLEATLRAYQQGA